MQEKTKRSRRDENKSSAMQKIIIGAVVGAVLFFILLALFALFALKSNVSTSSYMPGGIFLGTLSAFVCGFVAVKPLKQKGIPYGAAAGLAQALICSTVLFIANKTNAGAGLFILMSLMVAASAGGGIAAVNMKIRKKY